MKTSSVYAAIATFFVPALALGQPAPPPAEAVAPPPAEAVAPPPAEAAAPPTEAVAPPAEAAAPPAEGGKPEGAKAKPAPYSLPWQLRPVMPVSVIRSDNSLAFYKDPKTDASGTTFVSFLLAAYKVTPNFSPLIRLGMVANSPPNGDSGVGLTNAAIGATYGVKLSDSLKLGMFLGLAMPLGAGGGNKGAPESAAAQRAGIMARAALDNAMFAVNDLVLFPGLDFAYVNHGLTVQVEATVLGLARSRGEMKQKDEMKINFTTGLHVGYFVHKMVSLGVELRHQRWLSDPAAVVANPAARDNTTLEVGPRFHFKLGKTLWARPGIAYKLYLDDPAMASSYHAIHFDFPFPF